MEGTRCKLCREEIVDDVDAWCYGCRAYICDEHPYMPWGKHDIEEHDILEEE